MSSNIQPQPAAQARHFEELNISIFNDDKRELFSSKDYYDEIANKQNNVE